MSSHMRKGRQTRANTVSLPVICINDDDRVEKAKEAFSSLGPSRDSGRVRKVWQELRQVYEDTVNSNSNSDTHRPFPIWARSQFDPRYLEDLLTVGYLEDLLRVDYPKDRSPPETSAPSPSLHFKTEPWQFILHFDCIDWERVQAIKEICIKRPKLTFNQLYEEVQKNRLSRIKHEENPKYQFLLCDFKACLKESGNEDGSNAELSHEAEQNRAVYEEGNDNGNPENGHAPPANNTHPNSHKRDYTAGRDEDDDLERLSDIMNNTPRRSIPPRVSSLPIITRDKGDETDGDGEVATPNPPTPQVANRGIRRELSREKSLSLDPLADEGIFSSTEEELFQDRRSEFLIYKSLQVARKTTNERTEKYLRGLKEDQVAYAEKAKQIILNANVSHEEDIQPALAGIGYKMGKILKKRKRWEDDKEEREMTAAGPENTGYQAYYKKASL